MITRHIIFQFCFLFVSSLYAQNRIDSFIGKIPDLALDESGNSVAFILEDSIIVWDLDSNRLIRKLNTNRAGKLISLDLSHDGNWIVAGGMDKTLFLWNVPANSETEIPGKPEGIITSVKFSPDNSLIASGYIDGTIRIWRTNSKGGSPIVLKGHEKDISDLEFPDNDELISCGADGQIIIWDLPGKAIRVKWLAHHDWVRDLALSPDQHFLASCGDDSRLKIWNIGKPGSVQPVSDRKIGVNWLTGVDFYDNSIVATGGHGRKIIVEFRFGKYTGKTRSNITRLLFRRHSNPFELVYGTLEDGIYVVRAPEMKLKEK